MTKQTGTATIPRLNRSEPPPKYVVWFDDEWQCVCWGLEDDGQALNHPDDGLTEETAISAAWAHYQKRNDPPGMGVSELVDLEDDWHGADQPWAATVDPQLSTDPDVLACPFPCWLDTDGQEYPTEAEARAAAWAWYWRRVGLIERAQRLARARNLQALQDGIADGWAEILTWPDEQVAREERELAELEAVARG